MNEWLAGIFFVIVLFALWTVAIAALGLAPWLPTRGRDVERALRMLDLKPGERFYDLGSGDGRLVLAAARHGANATGIELALPILLISRLRLRFSGPKTSARLVWGDLFKTDLSDADAVFLFGRPGRLGNRLAAHLASLKPGARVVSYAFPIEGWTPHRTDRTGRKALPIHLYIR